MIVKNKCLLETRRGPHQVWDQVFTCVYVCVMDGSLICCHSCALKWSHLRTNSTIRAFHTQSSVEVCVYVSEGEDVCACVCEGVSRFRRSHLQRIQPYGHQHIYLERGSKREKERGRRGEVGGGWGVDGEQAKERLCEEGESEGGVFSCQ